MFRGKILVITFISFALFGFTEKARSIELAGSKQGQSVGFIDIDYDGIKDKVIGATSLRTNLWNRF